MDGLGIATAKSTSTGFSKNEKKRMGVLLGQNLLSKKWKLLPECQVRGHGTGVLLRVEESSAPGPRQGASPHACCLQEWDVEAGR